MERMKAETTLTEQWSECRYCHRVIYVGQINSKVKRFGFLCPYCQEPIAELTDVPPPLY